MGNPAELQTPRTGEGKELLKLIRKAEAGDQAALAKVKSLADVRLGRIWDIYGNLAGNIEANLVSIASGDNSLQKEALLARLEKMREEIAGANPSPLERMLAERIVLCWLQAGYEDGIDAAQLKKSVSWSQSLNQQKRAETAHRRLLSAIKALATIRRLELPNLQVNIGEKQVNIGTAQVGSNVDE